MKTDLPIIMLILYFIIIVILMNIFFRHIAYTKVNEIDARTIFPSFDNLNRKATFKIKIGHASTARAITNSELIYSRRM